MLPRFAPTVFTLGWILLGVAAGEVAIFAFSLLAGDGYAAIFGWTAAATAGIATACILTTKGRPFELSFRDAVVLTVTVWSVVPAFAALPLLADPVGLSPVDAYFEMVSGLTTTGSTVMVGLDTIPPSLLMWRSTVQWIGGVGIIGMAILILPFLRIGGMQLFRLESSDQSNNAIPRVRDVAVVVSEIYLLLTLACAAAYWMLGMTFFDALNHALTTLSTAGFSTHDASFGYFHSAAIEWAGVVFMTLGALPFLAYYRLVRGRFRNEPVDPQVVAFIATLAVLIFLFAVWLHYAHNAPAGVAITKAAFNIVSVVTTTGFASADYLVWGSFAAFFFLLITFVGGCTGSTAGAMKMFRFQVLFGIVAQHVCRLVYPHVVRPIRHGWRTVSDEETTSVGTFVFFYFLCFVVFSLALSATGLDGETSISAAATALGNVGPGLGPLIGPAGNFATLPDAAKLTLCLAMMIGRLEILSVLVLFLPSFYR